MSIERRYYNLVHPNVQSLCDTVYYTMFILCIYIYSVIYIVHMVENLEAFTQYKYIGIHKMFLLYSFLCKKFYFGLASDDKDNF